MGIFDRWFGKGPAADPEALRERLFDAAAAGEDLEGECRDHRAAITAAFPGWKTLPPLIRSDPAALQRWGGGLIAVARCFAERLGDPSLLALLTGPADKNPLVQWQERLAEARTRMSELRYEEASALLGETLTIVRGLQGPGADELLPITLGELGACRFHGGRPVEAIAPLEDALTRCARAGDREGVLMYLANLFEVHRYLGQTTPAAAIARRIGEMLAAQGHAADARRYEGHARRIAAGEPPCRVVAVVAGRPVEQDELAAAAPSGRVQFVFERDRISLRPAVVHTERGSALGAEGKYEEALAEFRAAAEADRHDPQCRYEAAFTLLHLRRPAEAAAAYAEVERLAPGWFHCRADRWLAEQIAAGAVDHAVFVAIHALQDGPLAPADKLALADATLARAPRVGLLHLLRARQLARLGRAAEAVQALRDGLAADPEPDTRARLLVELGATAGDPEERAALLTAARAPGGNLVAAAMAGLLLATTPPT